MSSDPFSFLRRWRCAAASAALLALLLPNGLAESRLVTRGELKAHGVVLKRVRHDTPMASMAIEVTIQPADTTGTYAGSECVVLREPCDPNTLAQVDQRVAEEKVQRRIRTDRASPSFLVLGRELPNAYLAFEFSSETGGGTEPLRLLIPVGSLGKRRPEEEPPPAEADVGRPRGSTGIQAEETRGS